MAILVTIEPKNSLIQKLFNSSAPRPKACYQDNLRKKTNKDNMLNRAQRNHRMPIQTP